MAYAVYLLASNTYFFIAAETAVGTVIGQVEMERPDRRYERAKAHAPYIGFKTTSGDEITFLSNVGYGEQFAFHSGDEIPVIYHADDPQSARVYSLFELFGLPVVAFVFGGIFWLCSFVVQFFAEHEPKDPDERRSKVNV